jgi:hypothetical protein
VAAACAGSAEVPSPEPAEESGETAWETVVAGITEDGVPLQVALEAFTLAIGPLPGVETPEGPSQPIPSGSGALRWTLGHWEELTGEQQAAIEDYLDTGDPTGAGPVLAMTGQVLAAEPDEQALLESIAQLEDVIAQNLGRDLGVPIELHVAPGLDDPTADALASATDVNGGFFGPMARCEITLTKSGSELASAGSSAELTSLLAHEVFHCFERALSINLVEAYTRPPWVVEGLAEWVGQTLAGDAEDITWSRWLTQPTNSLYTRAYTAIGFYAHLQENGADVWSTIDSIIEGSDEGDEAAYLTAIGAAGPGALITWGPGVFRDPTRAPEWDQDGPGITPEKYPPRDDLPEVANGTQYVAAAGALAADIWNTELNAEVVTLGGTGFGMILLPDGDELVIDGTLAEVLCTNPEGCSCPEGSPGAGTVFRITTPGSARIGLTGHLEGSQLSIIGWSLDAFCKNKPELAACLIGQWLSVSYEAESQAILSGTGAGVMLNIEDTGRGSIDFDSSVPIMAQIEGAEDVPVRIVQTGQALFEVIPSLEGAVIDSAVGVGYSIHAEVDLGAGFIDAGETVSLSGPSTGPGVTLTCDGDTLIWTGAGAIASYEFFRQSSVPEPVPQPPPDAVPLGGSGNGGESGGEGEGGGGGLPEPPPDWGLGLDACLLLSLEDVQAYAPEATQPAGEDDLSTQLLHQCTYLPAFALQVTPPQPPEFTGDAAEGIGLEVVPIEGIGDWAQAFVYPEGDTLGPVMAGNSKGTISITSYSQVILGSPEYEALLGILEKALAAL